MVELTNDIAVTLLQVMLVVDIGSLRNLLEIQNRPNKNKMHSRSILATIGLRFNRRK